jgi:beta-glucosidase
VLGCGFGPAPPELPRTSMGWPILPEAFRDTLMALDQIYGLPIYVLENGTAANDRILDTGEVLDPDRIDYLGAYITALREAIAGGADVRGYFVWSLLDNFEWNNGYSERFGLVHVDYETLQRTPKASARWYARVIRASREPSGAPGRPQVAR